MPNPVLFGISAAFSFVAWAAVAAHYLWPALKRRPWADGLEPILLLHSFRFLGLAFVLPGVVSPDLPAAFARPAAYGDLAAAILALLALAGLRTRAGGVLAWTFNIVGTADLLFAFYQGNRTALAEMPGALGAAYFIVILVVPVLLITHGLAFRLLLRREEEGPLSTSEREVSARLVSG